MLEERAIPREGAIGHERVRRLESTMIEERARDRERAIRSERAEANEGTAEHERVRNRGEHHCVRASQRS